MLNVMLSLSGAVLLGACASTAPGARPLDMSASEHEIAANQHERESASHAAAHDPTAAASTTCGSGARNSERRPCWTSRAKVEAQHLQDADEHHKVASEHRAASQGLRAAEESACIGLSEAERDESPFAHREDIVSASRLDATVSSGKGSSQRSLGATVVLRAVPNLTKEYLQRLVDCHLARDAAMGFDMPEMAFCPLSVKGARATVVSGTAGFGVEIRAEDTDAAAEVLKRARALVSGDPR